MEEKNLNQQYSPSIRINNKKTYSFEQEDPKKDVRYKPKGKNEGDKQTSKGSY